MKFQIIWMPVHSVPIWHYKLIQYKYAWANAHIDLYAYVLIHGHPRTQLQRLAGVCVLREMACQGLHSHWVCNDEVHVAMVTVSWAPLKWVCTLHETNGFPFLSWHTNGQNERLLHSSYPTSFSTVSTLCSVAFCQKKSLTKFATKLDSFFWKKLVLKHWLLCELTSTILLVE